MRYIGVYVWAIIFAIIGFNMYPELMAIWVVAMLFAGFMERKLQRKRQKKKEIEDEIENQKRLVGFAEGRLRLNEDACRILDLDRNTSPNLKAAKEELEDAERELKRLENELQALK